MTTRRQLRVAELLQRELGQLIAYELNDPRLEFVSVTNVDVSADLRHARIYVSQLGDEEAGREIATVLQHAAGHLRRELGQRIKLRYLPELTFHFDQALIASQDLQALLSSLNIPPDEDESTED